jgi:FkbM family methyltransferase
VKEERLRTLAKKIRPLLTPIVRMPVRYSRGAGRTFVWNRVVMPYFQWVEHAFVARTRFGFTIAGSTADLIQRYVYFFGVWEPHLTDFIRRRLRRGDVFIDVGANIGYFSLLASTLVGEDGKVIAIEASPSIHRRLQENLERNRVRNATVFHVAASDREGVLQIFNAGRDNCGASTTIASSGYELEAEVLAKPLDDLVAAGDLERAKVIKIDVEGAEWSVITGMRRLLERAPGALEIVIEITPKMERSEDILALFDEHGFHPYHLENSYDARHYISREPLQAPRRITEPIVKQTDVVFSRVDAVSLW